MITRQQAIASGLTQYDGRTCHVCGTTGRYTANGGCVVCCNERSAAKRRTPAGEERDKAQAARYRATETGAVTFTGRPCKHCGSTERYTSNAGCVSCIAKRNSSVREQRAALWHSDTSPVIWVQGPPAPELAYLYAQCPTLAAYGGNIHMIYSDAQHLLPGMRIYPGCDVLKRPAALQILLNDKTHPQHIMVMHLAPAFYPALRRFNLKVRRVPAESEEENLLNSVPRV